MNVDYSEKGCVNSAKYQNTNQINPMLKKSFWLIALVVLLLSNSLRSQNLIQGKILDRNTKEPLAFVHMLFKGESTYRCITDITGRFKIEAHEKIDFIECSYVGYQKLEFMLKPDDRLNGTENH
ncbi:MAG: carboxypeptidase-like regulatory domain-containing protein [Bacteroidales bacterium]|nr:carboxypeptidase-like regulatory domain-containing protein [Bacteroidales bacterium]